MSADVEWRLAIKSDRPMLMAFQCATEGSKSLLTRWKSLHPKPWENRVQAAVRDLRPPYKPLLSTWWWA